MARYTEAVCRLCRREGQKLFLKGDKVLHPRSAPWSAVLTLPDSTAGPEQDLEYGMQQREKQKARRYYGVLESQFRKYFEMASKRQGQTGENLLSILESRLDNTIYRLGFAMSRAEARQLVGHGPFHRQWEKGQYPQLPVKPGMVISLKESSAAWRRSKAMWRPRPSGQPPKWLEYDANNMVAKVVAAPAKEDIDLPIEEHLIVELYSK